MSGAAVTTPRAATAGALGGLLSGVFGVGGGVVMVPLFTMWLGMEHRRAVTTSLLAIIPISVGGALGYQLGGSVQWAVALALAAGSIVGGQVGVRLLPRIPVRYLQLAFALLLVYSAYRLVRPLGQGLGLSGRGDWVLLVASGVAAGMAAALLGVGGGIVLVPAMVLLAGFSIDEARGTSLIAVLATAATATLVNVRAGRVDVRAGWWSGLVGAPFGLLGSALGQWLPAREASLLFAVLMLLAAAQLTRKALTGGPEAPAPTKSGR